MVKNEFLLHDDYREVKTAEEKKERRKLRSFWSYVPGAFMFCVLLSISSLSTLIQFQFDFKEIVLTSFLLSAFLRIVIMFCARWVGADTRYKIEETSEQMNRARDRFLAMSQLLPPADFEEWVIEKNIHEKRVALKNGFLRCAEELRSEKARMEYSQKKKYRSHVAKKIDRITVKIEQAEKKCTDEYIDKNIGFLRARYNELHAEDFYSVSTYESDDIARYKMDYMHENSRSVMKSIPSMFLMMLICNMMSVNYIIGTVNVVSLLLDIFSLVLNFVIGYGYIGGKTASSMIGVYDRRRAVIDHYLTDRGRKKESASGKSNREEERPLL